MAGVIKSKASLARIGQVNSPMPIDPVTGEAFQPQRDIRAVADDQINTMLRETVRVELDRLVKRDSIEIGEEGKTAIIADLLRIHEINNKIATGYIAIGQLLLNIYNRSREVYDAIVSPYANILPIGPNVALKLRRIAEEVIRRRIDLSTFPPAYTTVYEIVTLEEQTYAWVMNEKLIHPKVGRDEIKKWKTLPLISDTDNSRQALEARLRERIKEKDRIIDVYEQRIRKIDDEIENLRNKIQGPDHGA